MNRLAAGALVVLAASGCGSKEAAEKTEPAKVGNAVTEPELTTVTLSAEAFRRLGVAVARADSGRVPLHREVAGEVIAPPGRTSVLTAPTAGTVVSPPGGMPVAGSRVRRGDPVLELVALPPDQSRVREAVEVTKARLAQAEAEAKRVADLYTDKLVSARDHERAQADLVAARASYETAAAQLHQVEGGVAPGRTSALSALRITAPAGGVIRTVSVGPGQSVAAGAPLLEIVGVDELWVRVPLYAGDVRSVAPDQAAQVGVLGDAGSGGAVARPVSGPPLADPTAATLDLFYRLAPDAGFRLGERVVVRVPLRDRNPLTAVTVPASALVMDASGGTWVYQQLDSLRFARRRVDVDRVVAGQVVIKRGIAAGTIVVIAGAAELFGTEFGPGH